MRSFTCLDRNLTSRELSSDLYCFGIQAFIDYNSLMESGYENFRLTLRKVLTGFPKEGKEQSETVTIKLANAEIDSLISFVNEFSVEYHKGFSAAQVDDSKPSHRKKNWKR